MRYFNTLIIGGGASGILLSILLKEKGVDCAVIESQDRILKKVLVTGNGRCNIANIGLKDKENIDRYFSTRSDGTTLNPLFRYDYDRIEECFSSLGIPFLELEDGKMYPMSLQASSVVDILRARTEELEIPLFTESRIQSLKEKGDQWNVALKNEFLQCSNLVIAAGGLAMPSTGSDGSIMKQLKELGLKTERQEPALVQLKTDYPSLRALQGVKNESRISLLHQGRVIDTETGELLFTDYGISGPPVLQLSRFCALHDYKDLTVSIDLFPEIEKESLRKMVSALVERFPERASSDIFSGMINKKFLPVLLKSAGIQKMTVKAEEIGEDVLDEFVSLLKNLTMNITGHNGYGNAQSTMGGISLKEIDLETMESVRYRNLYFTGEILDVCGACGGYNLTWAWASAMCCADAISSKKKR